MIDIPIRTPAIVQCAGPGMTVGPRRIVCPDGSISFTPGTAAKILAAAKPRDNSYCFAAGTYVGLSVRPRLGDKYIGMLGAVLDGDGKRVSAFYGNAPNVRIENFVIRNYAVKLQRAPVDNRNAKGSSWDVIRNEIASNGGVGVQLTEKSRLVENYIHHNEQECYACGGDGMRISGNEIAFNNSDGKVDWKWGAGGGKCWAATNLVVS